MPMRRSLAIEKWDFDDGLVLSVVGEVDIASVHELQEALRHADGDRVWIDLTGVDFIDSTGLTTLVLAHRRLDEPTRRLALICPEGSVRRVLEIAGIDRVIPVHVSLDDAAALT
jgi:anti-anti-sigma factor